MPKVVITCNGDWFPSDEHNVTGMQRSVLEFQEVVAGTVATVLREHDPSDASNRMTADNVVINIVPVPAPWVVRPNFPDIWVELSGTVNPHRMKNLLDIRARLMDEFLGFWHTEKNLGLETAPQLDLDISWDIGAGASATTDLVVGSTWGWNPGDEYE